MLTQAAEMRGKHMLSDKGKRWWVKMQIIQHSKRLDDLQAFVLSDLDKPATCHRGAVL
jgi:hypothetical protein